MTIELRSPCRSLASFLLLTLCVSFTRVEYAFPQQPQVPLIPDDVTWEPAIQYDTAGAMPVNLMMDVVRPRKQSGRLPAVVCIHGGGFRAGNRESYLPLCIRLAQRGYVAATVSYRLSPRDQFPAPVHDVKTAVRFLRANAARFGIDPERIGVTGGSALCFSDSRVESRSWKGTTQESDCWRSMLPVASCIS
jgi:acetyl esterase/lipase